MMENECCISDKTLSLVCDADHTRLGRWYHIVIKSHSTDFHPGSTGDEQGDPNSVGRSLLSFKVELIIV